MTGRLAPEQPAESAPGGGPSEYRLVTLGPQDIDRVMELERDAFDATIQARPETVLRRMEMGHQLLGAEIDDRLVGAIGFSTTTLGPEDFSGIPTTFKEYSTQSVPAGADTVCIYSLGIVPRARSLSCARLLIDSAFDHGRVHGMARVVADGPMPSFAGNEQVRPRPEVRAMVERYLATGEFPSRSDFLKDPVLALYARLTGCDFVRLIEGFLPEDEASGGWRVLLHRRLS